VLFKSLIGDSSDNIGGVKGIGEVRAKNLMKLYSEEEILHDFPGSVTSDRWLSLAQQNNSIVKRNIALITLKGRDDIAKLIRTTLNNHKLSTVSPREVLGKYQIHLDVEPLLSNS
jgi:5'-3' exonuclease